MHILLIPSWYPTAENPVAGIFFREQALALQRAGHRVGVLVTPTLRSKRELGKIRSVSELAASISVEDDCRLMTYRTSQWGWFPGFLPAGNRQLRVSTALKTFQRYVLEQGRPVVIHAHSILYGGHVGVQIGRRWGIPVVVTEHSSAFLRNLIQPRQAPVVRHTLQCANTRLAVGPALAASLREYCPNCPIELIGNMVDTAFFVPAQDHLPSPDFAFATVAVLTPNKGLHVLLQAFALAFADQPVRLRIGGDGSERDSLEAEAHRLGIADQVEFLGQLSRAEVRALVQQSHALVSSSFVETFGVVLLEAMACGKPVVATRSGGPESFVQEHSGLLASPGDPSSLAAAMQKMVQQYNRYDPDRIRADCVARFSEQAIVRQLDRIYHFLAASRQEDLRL